MKRKILGALLLGAMSLGALPASAGSVGLLAQTGLISGTQSFAFAMDVGSAGTLEVSLQDLNWQGRLTNLSFQVAGIDGRLIAAQPQALTALSAGTNAIGVPALKVFEVTMAGTYYAYVSATATGPYGIGLYGLNATFTSAVPLPAAGFLLLSGVGALAAARRRRAASPVVAAAPREFVHA